MSFIISADPGVENFSICVQDIEFADYSHKLESVELVKYTIKSLTEKSSYVDQVDCFCRNFEQLILKYSPKNVCLERFQVRGFRASGSTAELINIMLGICSTICRNHQIPIRLVVASEWKNHFNRISKIQLRDLYKVVKKLPPHCIDSMLIGWYSNNVPATFYTEHNLINSCSNLKALLDLKR